MKKRPDRRTILPPLVDADGAGFTLMEILLVLGLIALSGALLLPGVNSLLRSISEERPEQIVWDAVIAAREHALATNRTVWLRFDPETRRLAWTGGTGAGQKELRPDVKIAFLQPAEGAAILLGGVLLETAEVPAVRFYPDGTCGRFRVQITSGMAAAQIIPVDPWTCAPVLTAGK